MEKKSTYAKLRDMEQGDQLVIPFGEVGHATLAQYASTFGLDLGRKYTVHRDRATRTATVTRIY